MFKSFIAYHHKGFTLDDIEAALNPESELINGMLYRRNAVPVKERLAFLPFAEGAQTLVGRIEQYLVVRLMKEARTVPGALVRDELSIEVKKQEEATMKPVSRADRQAIKETVVKRLTDQALPRRSTIYVLFDEKTQRVYVSTGSYKQAESCLALLRKAISTLPVAAYPHPIVPDNDFQPYNELGVQLAECLHKGEAPDKFKLGSKVVLEETLKGGKGRGANLSMDEEWVQLLAKEGFAIEMELFWDDMSFVVTHDWSFKSVKWPADYFEEAETEEEPAGRVLTTMLLVGQKLGYLMDAVSTICLTDYDDATSQDIEDAFAEVLNNGIKR